MTRNVKFRENSMVKYKWLGVGVCRKELWILEQENRLWIWADLIQWWTRKWQEVLKLETCLMYWMFPVCSAGPVLHACLGRSAAAADTAGHMVSITMLRQRLMQAWREEGWCHSGNRFLCILFISLHFWRIFQNISWGKKAIYFCIKAFPLSRPPIGLVNKILK